ncbi:unnamed protein product [Chironomus riparius]|uniref:F-box domain-containing protein n=1 Tax=Chironomus riparius TaxID=315576 RepID=A0A9N9WLY4_9DIPT|nr:unnamed protein product [Chironomus riparius]
MTRSNKRKLRFETMGSNKRGRYSIFSNKRSRRPKTSINDMPNEILLNIFTYLGHKDTLKATLVNKNWNDLISNTKRTLEKVNRIYINDQHMTNGIPNFTRKYESIQIEDLTEWNPQLLKSLKKIGTDIKLVILDQCVFFDDDFKGFLECFPNLQWLEIYDCHPGISPLKNQLLEQKLRLNNLGSLIIRGYSWPLRLIETPNLEHFEANSLTLYDQEWLINFLNQQRSLQSLHLVSIFSLFDSRFGFLQPKFQLDELALYDLPDVNKNQLMRLLVQVKSTVRTLDIGFDIRRDITEYILKNFHLTCMSIDYSCLPTSMRFYDDLSPNESLTKVSIYGCVKKSHIILHFLKKHPGIKFLKLKALSNIQPIRFTFWSELSKVTPNVCCLKLGNLETYNMVYIKSQKLVHLDVDFIGHTNAAAWIQFCDNNPNIENFHVFKKHKSINSDIEAIIFKHWPKLKDIYFVQDSK